jgi:SAM-dependent methyltransferase
VDPETIRYYDEHAESFFDLYSSGESGAREYFTLAFPPGSEILDIGASSGRDLDILLRDGYEAYGVEPSPRLRAMAAAKFPRLQDRLYAGALPGLTAAIDRKFDGILCSGVFQHIWRDLQLDAATDIRSLLRRGGRLLLVVPKERPGIDASCRDQHGRLYTLVSPENLEQLFERLGFQRIGRWDSPDTRLCRPGYTWTTLLFDSPK